MEKEFEEDAAKFLVPLRVGEGLDFDAYRAFQKTLEKLRDQHRDASDISKRLALVLIDIYPQMIGIASLYEGRDQDIISDWAEDILELIHDVVT